MKHFNYILQAFGFTNFQDYYKSSFGFITILVFRWDLFLAMLLSAINFTFGFNHYAFIAFVILIIFEWVTGVIASLNRGEKHESRKFGRMLLKLTTYCVLIYILNQFNQHIPSPSILDLEIDPFKWLYWAVLLAIIWQLIISVLENLDSLGFSWAKIIIKIINKKFNKQFDLNENENNTSDSSTPSI